jgi:hypothetical protein
VQLTFGLTLLWRQECIRDYSNRELFLHCRPQRCWFTTPRTSCSLWRRLCEKQRLLQSKFEQMLDLHCVGLERLPGTSRHLAGTETPTKEKSDLSSRSHPELLGIESHILAWHIGKERGPPHIENVTLFSWTLWNVSPCKPRTFKHSYTCAHSENPRMNTSQTLCSLGDISLFLFLGPILPFRLKTQGPGKLVKKFTVSLEAVSGFPCCCRSCLPSLGMLPGSFAKLFFCNFAGKVGLWGALVCVAFIHFLSFPI